jgi:ribosomal protein L7/L12
MTENEYEDIIIKLKESGKSQIETIKVLVKEYKLGLKEADKLVINSKIWKDKLEQNIKMRNDFFDEMEKS